MTHSEHHVIALGHAGLIASRIGISTWAFASDFHAFAEGRQLVLAGVPFENFPKGPEMTPRQPSTLQYSWPGTTGPRLVRRSPWLSPWGSSHPLLYYG